MGALLMELMEVMEYFVFSYRFYPLILVSGILLIMLLTKNKRLFLFGLIINNIILIVSYIALFWLVYKSDMHDFLILDAFDTRILAKMLFSQMYIHILGLTLYGVICSVLIYYKRKAN